MGLIWPVDWLSNLITLTMRVINLQASSQSFLKSQKYLPHGSMIMNHSFHATMTLATAWIATFLVALCLDPANAQDTLERVKAQSEIKPQDKGLRLHEIQVIGTHNSYHLAPAPEIMRIIGLTGKAIAESIDYSHASLDQQLTQYGIRQIELDIYADPQGGLYSNPVGRQISKQNQPDPRMPFDFDTVMRQPGTKIIHAPGFDFATHVPTLKAALEQTVAWSKSQPGHLPILILLEIKESATGPAGVKPIKFDRQMLDALDEEIRSCIPAELLLTPDEVRGDHKTLREAIVHSGWPTLESCSSKIFFALDNTDSLKDRYLEDHESLHGRVMFTSVSADHPAAAWMKINDPINDFDKIQQAVKSGFLVRTRADSDTKQARKNDTIQRDRAIDSGAQFISTDYPEPDPRWSQYRVQWPDRAVYRRNPVTSQ
jgi:hypothetical protein